MDAITVTQVEALKAAVTATEAAMAATKSKVHFANGEESLDVNEVVSNLLQEAVKTVELEDSDDDDDDNDGNTIIAKRAKTIGIEEIQHSTVASSTSSSSSSSYQVVDKDHDRSDSDTDTDSDSGDDKDGDEDGPILTDPLKSKKITSRPKLTQPYRLIFSKKDRKTRIGATSNVLVRQWQHNNQPGSGGVVVTNMLRNAEVLVENYDGSVIYEPIKVHTKPPAEMRIDFINSSEGAEFKKLNKGRDISMNKFTQYLCPCTKPDTFHDAADMKTAAMRYMLKAWSNVRRFNETLKQAIKECAAKGCKDCKHGSDWQHASDGISSLITAILCPPQEFPELTVKGRSLEEHEQLKSFNVEAAKIKKEKAVITELLSFGPSQARSRAQSKPLRETKSIATSGSPIGETVFKMSPTACYLGDCDEVCGPKKHFMGRCQTEWSCLDSKGNSVGIRIKVKEDQDRGGKRWQAEFVWKHMNMEEFRDMMIDFLPEFLKHHVADLLSGVCRRKFYDPISIDSVSALRVISASDHSSQFDGHPQHRANSAVPVRGSQLVTLLTYPVKLPPLTEEGIASGDVASGISATAGSVSGEVTMEGPGSGDGGSADGVLGDDGAVSMEMVEDLASTSEMKVSAVLDANNPQSVQGYFQSTIAFHFWYDVRGKVPANNFMYYCAMKHALNFMRYTRGVSFNRLLDLSDGCGQQFKSCIGVVSSAKLCEDFNLVCVEKHPPPTGTMKGEHDMEGNHDKVVIREAEKIGNEELQDVEKWVNYLISHEQTTSKGFSPCRCTSHSYH